MNYRNNADYDMLDSEWLLKEFNKQAREKYLNGEYELDRLNKDGQRINIEIDLPRKNQNGSVTFVSGWMLAPNGTIQLATPYGAK